MISEDQLEQLAIQWFQDTGWSYLHGNVIAPQGDAAEREDRGYIEHRTLNIERRSGEKRRLAEAVHRAPTGYCSLLSANEGRMLG